MGLVRYTYGIPYFFFSHSDSPTASNLLTRQDGRHDPG